MMHLELHVIQSPHDAELADLAGLIELTDNESCEHCGDPVGFDRNGKFTPLVAVLDEESIWVVCPECASPVLAPIVYEGTDED